MTVNFPNWMPANPAPLKQVRYQHTFVRALEG